MYTLTFSQRYVMMNVIFLRSTYMIQEIHFVYISLTGNTHSFVTRLAEALVMKKPHLHIHTTNVKELVKENEEYFALTTPCFAFLPTYLEGGNGIDSGYTEILTTPLGDFLAAHDNYRQCLGIIGSGNRNFNKQFCLTARQYAERFQFPVLDEFELRGTSQDVIRIADNILNKIEN